MELTNWYEIYEIPTALVYVRYVGKSQTNFGLAGIHTYTHRNTLRVKSKKSK